MATSSAANRPQLTGPQVVLTVSDVKQYPYCPRVVYFTYLLPQRSRPATYKMAEGKLQHERIEALEERRSLRAYGLTEGVRHFDVALRSERWGLSGRLDMVIQTPREVIPVDFKNSEGKVGLNHKYQLTGYALLVEDAWRRPVRRGFIYLVPQKRAHEVAIASNMRGWVRKTLEEVRRMLREESMPPPTRLRGRCADCEFRNYCNDMG